MQRLIAAYRGLSITSLITCQYRLRGSSTTTASTRHSNQRHLARKRHGIHGLPYVETTGMKRTSAFPLRRGSASSDEPDFFDVPEEPCLAIVKRQLRRIRTWVIVFVLIVFVLYLRREPPPPPSLPHIQYDLVDWSRYAYSQYATSSAYLCNAVMVFESLHRLGSRAQRVLFYPENWNTEIEDSNDRDSQLLVLARDKYNVLLVPIDLDLVKEGSGMWMHSIRLIWTERLIIACAVQGLESPGTRVSRNCLRSERQNTSV